MNYSNPENGVLVRQDDPSVPEIIEGKLFHVMRCYEIKYSSCIFLISDITTFLIVAHTLGVIIFLLTTAKFFLFVPTILRNTPKQFLSRTLFLCGFYSILSASAYTSMMVPRAFLFCDGITLVTFSIAIYEFFW